MNDTELATADDLRKLVAIAAAAVTAPPDLAGRVLAQTDARRPRRGRWTVGLALVGAASALAAAGLTGSADYRQWTQPSGAMAPTVLVGQTVLLGEELVPERGDVVLLTADDSGSRFRLLSRVIGLPGDTVECPVETDGTCTAVRVSGRALPEPWITAQTDPFPSTTVGPDQLFVLGDARDAANDSRLIGTQPLAEVLGVAVARIADGGRREPLPGAPARELPSVEEVDPADPVPPSSSD